MNKVNIWKETGLLNEIKIITERNMPYYEKTVIPIYAYIKDRLHDKTARRVVKEVLSENLPYFREIIIESVSKCNGICSFCPVNRRVDPRETVFMETSLFHKIIDQLQDMNYSGVIQLHGNNEPLLDDRIESFLEYVYDKIPKAHKILYTNGILLTIERFQNIVKYLDEFYIDNYDDNRKINKKTQMIIDYLDQNSEYIDRVHFNIIRPTAIRNIRGGEAGNRTKVYGIQSPCLYPFVQISIRADGKVSLCCNDALGYYTLGDTHTQSLLDIWNSQIHKDILDKMVISRKRIDLCCNCDVFHIDSWLL